MVSREMLLCAAMPPNAVPTNESLMRRVYCRLEPEIEASLVDNATFLLIFVGLLITEIVFRIFRFFGIDSDFLNAMERMDHYAVACIFGMFCWRLYEGHVSIWFLRQVCKKENVVIERLRQYVLVDHRTRMRNDLLSVGASIAWYGLSITADVPNADAIRVSLYFLVGGVVISTGWYVFVPRRIEMSAPISISKRFFLPRFTAAAFLVLVGLGYGSPALEAAIVDHRLRQALKGEPTLEKFAKAQQIVTEAHERRLRASPSVVSRLGAKILESSTAPQLRQAALSTAIAFGNYRSSLSPLPEANYGPINGQIQVGCISDSTGRGSPVLEGVPWFYHLDFRNCSQVAIKPLPPINTMAQLQLDGLNARNIVFIDGTFSYEGGEIHLDSIQFVSSRLQVTLAHAENPNVRRFLAAFVTGQPITLTLN